MITSIASTAHETLKQLHLLGYSTGDRVWVRLLVPKKTPMDVAKLRGMTWDTPDGKTVVVAIDGYLTLHQASFNFTRVFSSGSEKRFSDGWKALQQFNQQGYGIYYVVNPGGRDDADISHCPTLFYECDRVSKDEQWQRLQELEQSYLGKPASLVVETRNSLHVYLRLTEAIDPDEWRILQQRLIQQQDSDPSIHNPSRLMRLAGFAHWAWNGESLEATPVKVIQASDASFAPGQFNHFLPAWDEDRWKKTYKVSSADRTYATGGDGWDIRSFASLLDGYNPHGRRGWITCKCPVHGGDSDNSLHIEESTGAFKCHGGCDSKEIYHTALELAQARGYVLPKGDRKGRGKADSLPSYALTFEPSVVVTSKFLGDVAIPAYEKLGVLRAPKGGGKTQLMAQVASKAIEVGKKIWVITYREQLGKQLSLRFGLNYKTEIWETPEGRLFGFCLCVDSLHPNSEARFTADGTDNDLVIVDECESVFWHTLDGSTCTENRLAILSQLKELLTRVLSPDSQGQVLLADADCSDLSVNFVRQLAGVPDLKPFVVRSDWKPEQGWTVYDYEKATDLWFALRDQAADGNHLVLTTGQRADSKWGTQTIESALKERYPDKRILRIDSQTIANPEHPAYGALTKDINSLLAAYDIVLASPTIESGVSIDLYDHFAGVWCFATGAIPENGARQFLARLRDAKVPRHLFAAERGINFSFVGNGEIDPAALLQTEQKKARINLHTLQDSGLTVDADGSVQFNPIALETWGRMGARVNQGLACYHDAIVAGLRAEGHTVVSAEIRLDKEASKSVSEEMGEVRDTNHEAEAQAIAAVEPITSEQEYEELQQKRSKTDTERWQQRQYELASRYAVPVTAELVQKDDSGWHQQIRTHYFLTVGADFLKQRERRRFEDIANIQGQGWIPDINKRLVSFKVTALKLLGIPELLAVATAGEELHNQHPIVEAIAIKSRKFASEVKEFLGVEVSDRNSNMGIVQELLAQSIGFRLVKIGQRTIDGKRVRVYSYPDANQQAATGPYDGRAEVFQAWLQRDQATVIEEPIAVATAGEELHTKTPYISKGDSCADVGVQDFGVQDLIAPPPSESPPQVLAVGAIVRWKTSLAEWVVLSVDGAIAKIKQVSGWASNLLFEANLSELHWRF